MLNNKLCGSDGRLVSGSLDKTIKLWYCADRRIATASSSASSSSSAGGGGAQYKHFLTFSGHTGTISALCALPLPDGRVVSGATDGTLRIWDTHTPDPNRHCLYVIKAAHTGVVASLAVSAGLTPPLP
jgi:WD40 repeat protein